MTAESLIRYLALTLASNQKAVGFDRFLPVRAGRYRFKAPVLEGC